MKGLILAAFVVLHENEFWENVGLWILFSLVPSFILALIIIFGRTFYKTSNCCGWGNHSLGIIIKEPSIMIAPVITPFMHAPRNIKQEKIKPLINGKGLKQLYKIYYFELDYRLSHLNNIVSCCLSCIGLMKFSKLNLEFILLSSVLTLTVTAILMFLIMKSEDDTSKTCLAHEKWKSECVECTTKFGLRVESDSYIISLDDFGKKILMIILNSR